MSTIVLDMSLILELHILIVVVWLKSILTVTCVESVLWSSILLTYQPISLVFISIYTLTLILWRHFDSSGQRLLAKILTLYL